jgi:hypothetical protein
LPDLPIIGLRRTGENEATALDTCANTTIAKVSWLLAGSVARQRAVLDAESQLLVIKDDAPVDEAGD